MNKRADISGPWQPREFVLKSHDLWSIRYIEERALLEVNAKLVDIELLIVINAVDIEGLK